MKIINIPRRFVKEEWGGTETVILETCLRLKQRGHDIGIFTSMALANNKFELINSIKVKRFAHFYPYFGLNSELIAKLDKKGGNLFSWPLFFSLLREPECDLFHLHTGKRMAGIAARAAMLKRIPYIISLHGGFLDVPDLEAHSWTEPTKGCYEWGKILGAAFGSRQVLQNAAAVICVSSEEAAMVKKAGLNKRVYYLPNGVDTKKFDKPAQNNFRSALKIPENAFVALSCGRIDPQKNQLFLVQSMPRLLKIWPNLVLVLLGPTTNHDYQRKIEQQIQKNNLESRVILAGGRPPDHPDLLSAYKQADIFMLPSVHEPFGIVILEAWAAGLPVVASRTGGIPGFTSHEKNIMLFSPGDTESLIECCEKLKHSPELSSKIASNGKLKAKEEYDWEIITCKLEKLYREIL